MERSIGFVATLLLVIGLCCGETPVANAPTKQTLKIGETAVLTIK